MILLLNENKYSLTRDGYSVCFVFKINCVCLKAKSFKFSLFESKYDVAEKITQLFIKT